MPSLMNKWCHLYPEVLEKSPAEIGNRPQTSSLPYNMAYLRIMVQFEGFPGGIVQNRPCSVDNCPRNYTLYILPGEPTLVWSDNMYKGTVDFVAEIKGNGLTFPRFDFDPHEPGVVKVEIEGLDGNVIRSRVHLTGVQSPEAGITLAGIVNAVALTRVVFFENIAIENGRVEREDFSSLDDQPGARELTADTGRYSLIGSDAKLTVGRSSAQLKAILEKPAALSERFFGLFRSARQSVGPIEEFMHLYHILLMLFNDIQANVDAFILSKEPSIPQTPDPRKYLKRKETVYARLRNDFAHIQRGADIDHTKAEMTHRLGDLRTLTRQAIEQTTGLLNSDAGC